MKQVGINKLLEIVGINDYISEETRKGIYPFIRADIRSKGWFKKGTNGSRYFLCEESENYLLNLFKAMKEYPFETSEHINYIGTVRYQSYYNHIYKLVNTKKAGK